MHTAHVANRVRVVEDMVAILTVQRAPGIAMDLLAEAIENGDGPRGRRPSGWTDDDWRELARDTGRPKYEPGEGARASVLSSLRRRAELAGDPFAGLA
jgi:hypothetical protein